MAKNIITNRELYSVCFHFSFWIYAINALLYLHKKIRATGCVIVQHFTFEPMVCQNLSEGSHRTETILSAIGANVRGMGLLTMSYRLARPILRST